MIAAVGTFVDVTKIAGDRSHCRLPIDLGEV